MPWFRHLPTRPIPTRLALGLLAVVAVLTSLPGVAAAQQRVRFALDWALQGSGAPWLIAERLGYFREEGIVPEITASGGSGEFFGRLAAGNADIGTADLASMIVFSARNPANALQAVAITHARSTVAIMALTSSGIRSPADLRGRTVAGPENDAGRLLWPALARAVGMPVTSVTFQNTTAALREPMVVRGQAAAMSGLTTSGVQNLIQLGARREDIVVLRYADYGVPLYGHALITRPGWAEANPRLVTGVIRAMVRGLRASLADPDAAIAALKAREPLSDPAIELARLRLTMEEAYLPQEVLENGFGRADPARLSAMIAAVADAFALPNPPAPAAIFTDRYLPPAPDLMVR